MTHSFYWEQHTRFGLSLFLLFKTSCQLLGFKGGRSERNVSASFWNKYESKMFAFQGSSIFMGLNCPNELCDVICRTHTLFTSSHAMTSQLKANLHEANRILHTINNRSRLWKENKRRLEVLKLCVKHLRDWRGDDAKTKPQWETSLTQTPAGPSSSAGLMSLTSSRSSSSAGLNSSVKHLDKRTLFWYEKNHHVTRHLNVRKEMGAPAVSWFRSASTLLGPMWNK